MIHISGFAPWSIKYTNHGKAGGKPKAGVRSGGATKGGTSR